MATIYYPNGNPSLGLFRMINALSNQVIFLGDFNSKHKQFGCVKPNKSGQTLVNIAKDLKLFYVNQLGPNRYTRDDPFQRRTGGTGRTLFKDELEELAVTLCDKLMKAVDTSMPEVYSRNDPKSPISQAILDLIKEKRRLRRLYSNTQDPNIKSTIDRLQKEIRTKIKSRINYYLGKILQLH